MKNANEHEPLYKVEHNGLVMWFGESQKPLGTESEPSAGEQRCFRKSSKDIKASDNPFRGELDDLKEGDGPAW